MPLEIARGNVFEGRACKRCNRGGEIAVHSELSLTKLARQEFEGVRKRAPIVFWHLVYPLCVRDHAEEGAAWFQPRANVAYDSPGVAAMLQDVEGENGVEPGTRK